MPLESIQSLFRAISVCTFILRAVSSLAYIHAEYIAAMSVRRVSGMLG
nr:MAG TPA: BM2 protein [Caudoviricetes sp.]